MRSIWKGELTFGLVNVPVRVYLATQDHDVPLHQVHATDGGQIHYQRVCELDGQVVPYEEIDRAYQDEEVTIILSKEELQALPSQRSREIEVIEFVPTEQIDVITVDRAYYLEPSGSAKAYVLLRRTLEQTDRTAIVRVTLRQRTRLAALRVRGNVLVLQTLLWADEVREPQFPALENTVRISNKELELSAALVEGYSADFDPTSFGDEYQRELRRLIEEKRKAGEGVAVAQIFGDAGEGTDGEVIDLMAALKASVERAKKGQGRKKRAN